MSNFTETEFKFDDLLVSPGKEVDDSIDFCNRMIANHPTETLSGWSVRATHEGLDLRDLPTHVWMHSHDYDEVAFEHNFRTFDTFEWFRDFLTRNRTDFSILLLMLRLNMVPQFVWLDRIDFVRALRKPPVLSVCLLFALEAGQMVTKIRLLVVQTFSRTKLRDAPSSS